MGGKIEPRKKIRFKQESKNIMKKRSGRRLTRRVTRTPAKTIPRGFLRQDLACLRCRGGRGTGGLNAQSRNHRPPIQFVRPCWLGMLVSCCWLVAGGVPLVVRSWWRGWWLGLSFHRFFYIFCRLGHDKNTKSRRKFPTKGKSRRISKT